MMKYDIVLFREFTQLEIDNFIAKCNFTEDELQYLLLRCKDFSNTYISLEMHISESQVSKLARRVKNKIKKVV